MKTVDRRLHVEVEDLIPGAASKPMVDLTFDDLKPEVQTAVREAGSAVFDIAGTELTWYPDQPPKLVLKSGSS